jgi:thiamine transporter ThiT
MILVAYRLLCAVMAALAVWSLLREGTRQQKVAAALVMVPLVLRALLIK